MKKSLFSMGMLCIALTLTNCQKEQTETIEPAAEPNFELFAKPADTKTANDGLNTKWAAGDAINIFHAEAGKTSYENDGQFSLKDVESGKFEGTIAGTLTDGTSYDWYAFYPYTSQIVTPANTNKGWVTVGGTAQTQTGNDSRDHIAGEACPLYGISKSVAKEEVPSIKMENLASVIKVNVTNNSGEDLTVSSVAFTGTEDIVGTYYINFAASPVIYKSSGDNYVSTTATLSIKNGEAIANGSSAAFYIAVKPFTANAGSTLKLAVNGYEKTITLKSDVTFTAGHIKTLGFDFDKVAEDYSGTYLLLNSDKTKVCPAFTSENNNIPAEDYSADKIDDSWVMTIKKISGSSMYTIQDANGMYLSTGATKAKNYLVGLKNADESRSSWAISSSSDGSYSIVATNSSYRNILRYNTSSRLFSCYASGQDPVTLVEYIPLPSLAKPKVEADVNTAKDGIDVIWSDVENATKYVVSCTGQADVEVAPGEEYASFTGLAVGQEYTVTVTASAEGYKSATSDESKVTIPDPRTPLATPDVDADVIDVNSIYVMWQEVDGAADYTVTCGDKTVTTSETEYTFTGLAYSTEYTVSVVANPADATVNTPSAPGTAIVTTGANPSGETITYQHIFTAKPSTGSLSGVNWTVEGKNLGAYNSGNYAGVQFGTKSNSGSITLTSSAWSYKEKSKIKEVRIWLNAGTGVPTATVTIGEKETKSDGKVVQKNSNAKTYKDATMLTFTPVEGGDSGVVVINASTSSKAAYICAMEIDCF